MKKIKVTMLAQRLMGIGLMVLASLLAYWSDNDITPSLIIIPIGLWLTFSRENLMMDDYYIVVRVKKGKRRKS